MTGGGSVVLGVGVERFCRLFLESLLTTGSTVGSVRTGQSENGSGIPGCIERHPEQELLTSTVIIVFSVKKGQHALYNMCLIVVQI